MKKYILRFKGLFFINIISVILASLVSVSMAFVLQLIIDAGTAMDMKKLKIAAIIGFVFILIEMLTDFTKRALQAKFIKKALTSLKNDIFHKILNRNIKSFNQENSANYISVLNNDIKILEDDYFINILQSIYHIAAFIASTIALILINPILTVAVFIVGVLPILTPIVFGKKVSRKKTIYSDNLSKFTTKIKDMFSGFEVIKSFNIEKRAINDYEKSNMKTEHSKYKFNLLSSFVYSLSVYFGGLMFIVALSISMYFVIKGTMSMGLMIASIQLMNHIVNPLLILSNSLTKLKSIKGIEKKITNILNDKSEADTGIDTFEFKNDIRFDNIEFSYDEDRKILNGVSLTIEKGQKYAIVGNSGSGKSTLLKLLLRYYEDYNGHISIDGIDNRKIKVSSLYNLVSTIHQDVFMFDDTIKNNITLYGNYSEDEINNAIIHAGLESLINSLKEGVNNFVGENGCNLSGGEKQRIAIARALIKQTPILVLDEATSSLDNETAYNIENSILSIEGLTSLVITHKLNEEILNKYDGIIVLKDGKVVEVGEFDNLLDKKSYFYSLYNLCGI
ncbi:ABC transporter ATP-binding protein [Oceanirhabdus seepicola]|uniref:ABC transporter ATP-binding protein n=1 Tax=Oceanirhabdus seepicola TaxID=2828781 RepID=A0A9J6NZR8_9CLOT|nr:ABC transporter ATP-binding protein [Oceanirhabdus seepicola]MCM1989588.1 ABC transporter ATP-binding protein [Oceanirhabdus seepicola]